MPTDQNGTTQTTPITTPITTTDIKKSDDITLSLNLEDSAPIDTSAVPEITLDIGDDRLAKEDKIVEENIKVSTPKTTESVIEEAVPVEKVIEQKVEEVANQEEKKPEGGISHLFVEIEPEAVTEPIKEATTEVIAEPVIETITEPVIEAKPIIEEVKPVIEIPVVETTPVATAQVITPTTTPQSINLDDIFGNTPAPVMPAPVISPISDAPMINPVTNQVINTQTVLPAFNSNPTNNINNPIPSYNIPIANIQNQPLPANFSSKKILIDFVIGIAIFVMLGFVFKTMYPIQYNNLIGANKVSNSIDSNIDNTNTIPQDTLTLDNTGLNQSTGVIGNQPDSLFANTTGDTHGAATDQSGFDAFADINQATEDIVDIEATKTKLQEYIDAGKKSWVAAKKTNDKELLKNSLYLWKKAETFMNRIATGEEITNDEITQELQKFEESLTKLNSSDAETVSGQDTTQEPIQTPIPSPADFFSNQENPETGDMIEATGDMIE